MVLAGWDKMARGGFAVGDTVKDSAAEAMAKLRRLGLHTVLLSGDAAAAAITVAAATGIDEVIADALPQAKVEVVAGLREQRPVRRPGRPVTTQAATEATSCRG